MAMNPAAGNALADQAFLRLCGMTQPRNWSAEWGLEALDGTQWERVGRRARHHGLAGLVARNLEWIRELGGPAAPIVEPLAALRRGVMAQGLARKAAGRRVAEALERAGIPFIVLKGVVLAEETYGDLSLRGFNDFDVMVPLECVSAAHATVANLGYALTRLGNVQEHVRCGAHAADMANRDGTSVDLHWALAPDLLEAHHREFAWTHSVAAPAGGLPGLRLAPSLALLHHAKHFHSHQYVILKPLVDYHVTRTVHGDQIDPSRVAAMARALDLTQVVEIVETLAQRSFGDRRPAASGPARFVNDALIVDAENRPRLDNWVRFLLAAGGLRPALRSVAEILFPSRLVLAQFFNRPFSGLLYPRYYWRQVVKILTLSPK